MLLDSRAKGKRSERGAARRQQPPSIQGLRILQVSGLGHGMDIGARPCRAHLRRLRRGYILGLQPLQMLAGIAGDVPGFLLHLAVVLALVAGGSRSPGPCCPSRASWAASCRLGQTLTR
jgi:hypothetical protein